MIGGPQVLFFGTPTREFATFRAALFKVGIITVDEFVIRHSSFLIVTPP
jgi:hypothetical protein